MYLHIKYRIKNKETAKNFQQYLKPTIIITNGDNFGFQKHYK